MNDIIEGVGTATEGSLWARALEPASGAKKRHADDPEECANCGAALEGAYCHACGQPAHLHRSLKGVMHDVLHGALHLDGKMWRTLPVLALRPGRLTRQYIDGARVRFVSPMALFLFSVFLMFAVFQLLGISAPTELNNDDAVAMSEEVELPDTATEDGKVDLGTSAGGARYTIEPSGIKWLDEKLVGKWTDNPGLMLYKMQANAYKFSWMLIPLSLPFMWLLFAWKRQFKVYDHAIFVTYSLSFMTLLFVSLSLAGAAGVGGGWLFTIFATIAPLHIYKQLKHSYALSRFSAIWRLLVLLCCILIIMMIFVQMLLFLGLF